MSWIYPDGNNTPLRYQFLVFRIVHKCAFDGLEDISAAFSAVIRGAEAVIV